MTATGPQSTGPIVLLGPQTDYAEVRAVLDELQVDGPIALITAGWQENESEDVALVAPLRRRTVVRVEACSKRKGFCSKSGMALPGKM